MTTDDDRMTSEGRTEAMTIRRARARRAAGAVAITVGAVLAVAGCGGEGEAPAPEKSGTVQQPDSDDGGGTDEQKSQVLAEVTGGDITLRITSALREEGGFVTVEGTVTNNGSDVWVAPGWQGDEAELADNGASMAGAKLVDKQGRKQYYILRDTEGRCLCTQFTLGVKPGETTNWYAQFPAPPRGSDEVDFQIANMPPATITISEG